MNKSFLKALGLSVALLSPAAQAISLDWTGTYRAEWTEVDRPTLGTPAERKSYLTNYLHLNPKIIAADGVNIHSRFNVFSSSLYPDSQVGQIWGLNDSNSPATSNNQGEAHVTLNRLYLTVEQEYGAFIFGRAPFEFGMGMTYSAGNGAFDHWYDTQDYVAYKIVVGDWFLMPKLGKKQARQFAQGNSISTVAAQLQYESAENKSLLGVYMENQEGRQSVLGYNQTQIDAYAGGAGGSIGKDLKIQRTNFVLGRGFDSFEFKLEAGFESGDTGVVNSSGDNVTLNGFGIATELLFPRPESKWDWRVRMGMATGDDGDSAGFGAYQFNRNYDVALLLFNHRLGQADFLNTDVVKGANANTSVGNSADDESISNTLYLAPSVNYHWSDNIKVRNTLVYAQLMNVQKNSVDSTKDLGLEWDIEVIYQPIERIQWVNQVGFLFPGEAFKNGSAGYENGFTFGFASKAAISF